MSHFYPTITSACHTDSSPSKSSFGKGEIIIVENYKFVPKAKKALEVRKAKKEANNKKVQTENKENTPIVLTTERQTLPKKETKSLQTTEIQTTPNTNMLESHQTTKTKVLTRKKPVKTRNTPSKVYVAPEGKFDSDLENMNEKKKKQEPDPQPSNDINMIQDHQIPFEIDIAT